MIKKIFTYKFMAFTFMLMCSGFVTGTVIGNAMKSFEADQALWNSENVCIAEKVALGIERADIVRDNGGCYVKTK